MISIGKSIGDLLRGIIVAEKTFGDVVTFNSSGSKKFMGAPAVFSLRCICTTALVVISTIQANFLYAQQSDGYLDKKNQYRIGLGVSLVNISDLQYSPIMYRSLRKDVQLGFSSNWKKGIFSTNLNFSVGRLRPSSGELNFFVKETDIYGTTTVKKEVLELSQMGLNLEIGYLHRVVPIASSKTAIYVGGSLEENLTLVPGFLSIGTINYVSLNAKARLAYVLGNGKPIIFQIALPLVSVVTRVPYHSAPVIPGKSVLAGFFTGNNNVETLNHFQNVRIAAKYNLLVKKRMALDVTFHAAWIHYYKPQHLTQLSNQLSLGFIF
jgi:hypothetical protein